MAIDNKETVLELNPNDKSFDAKSIPKPTAILRRSIAGFFAGLMLFSGSCLSTVKVSAAEYGNSTSVVQEYNESDDKIVDIPEAYRFKIANLVGKNKDEEITIGDLKAATYDDTLILHISDNSSLKWMNYLRNIKSVLFIIDNNQELTRLPFKDIYSLEGFESISFSSYFNASLCKEDCEFLKRSKDCKRLDLYGVKIEDGVVESLDHLKKLGIMNQNILVTSNIDFSKLTFLDEIDFSFEKAYDIAINLTKSDYETLKDSGVSIHFSNPEELSKLIEVNNKLDNIVKSLGVSKESSDSEKLDAVLIYVLESYEYSREIIDKESEIESITKEAMDEVEEKQLDEISEEYKEKINVARREYEKLVSSFYSEGRLYSTMESDSIICGNYAAITSALLDRLDIRNEILTSGEKGHHAWTLAELDGQYYYVDATWLDAGTRKQETRTFVDDEGCVWQELSFVKANAEEFIKEGDTENLEWYKEDPTNYPISTSQPYAHEAVDLPSFIHIKPIEPIQSINDDYEENTVPEETMEIVYNKDNQEISKETNPIEITEETKFEITIKNRKFIVGGAVALGIMSALGGAVAVHHHKKKLEAERRRQREYNNTFDDFDYDSFDTYNSYNNSYYR